MLVLAVAAAMAAQVTTTDPSPRVDARAALGRSALRALTALSSDGDGEVRTLAAKAWGEIGNPAAIPFLRKTLRDKRVSARIEAAYALSRLGSDEGVDVLEKIVKKSSAGKDGVLSPSEEMKLMAMNKSRVRAIGRLSEIGGERAVALFEVTIEDASPAVRDATAVALARMGFEEFSGHFFEALKETDESVRAAAVSALGEIGGAAAFAALRQAAVDSSVPVRVEVMRVLGRYGDPSSAAILARGVADPDPRVRAAALASLARLPDQGTVPLLQQTLKENNAIEAQLKASAGLAVRGLPSAGLQAAEKALSGKDDDLKRLALELLEAVDTDESNAMLKAVMDADPDSRLKVQAAAALVKRLQRRTP